MRILKKIFKALFSTTHDELTSVELRERFHRQHNIEVGLYSYGCFDSARFTPGTKIGRYCSFAEGSSVFTREHGLKFVGTTPYLYNSKLGLVEVDRIPYLCCDISDDVWVGKNAMITARVRRIGRGAVIAANAVVTHDVAPYTIVGGVPARVISKRFDDATIEVIEKSRWWEWSLERLREEISNNPEFIFSPDLKHA